MNEVKKLPRRRSSTLDNLWKTLIVLVILPCSLAAAMALGYLWVYGLMWLVL
jgi:hypothetical protein